MTSYNAKVQLATANSRVLSENIGKINTSARVVFNKF